MEIIKYSKNPILTKEDVPFRVNSIFNPGAVKFDNRYLLLCRVELPTGKSVFVNAWSENGINFKVENQPCFVPADHGKFSPYVEWGIEDARITRINDSYYLTYTGYSNYMPCVILSETKDFKSFNVLDIITEPSNKDCAIFPERINGKYYKMDRPAAETRRDIWINESTDLIHWGSNRMLYSPAPGTWEVSRVGNSTPPVRTDEGWLFLYHGVRGPLYKIGAMLLDIDEPWKVIAKTNEPILSPDLIFERVGDVTNAIFTNGWIVEENGDIKIYYSGADTNICIATTTVKELLALCKKQ
ncbi:beta-1,4-mannooligosaccharide phosphorylase [bacterium BMS3Abin04]|nr:beta-1,4-mannooligosaccharide phosphorylase [bacterium BMS3Abin04]